MELNQKQLYEKVARDNVNPARYGKVALTEAPWRQYGLERKDPVEHGWEQLDGYDGAEEPIFGD